MKIRTRAEIMKSMGMHPGASADCSDECINRVAIIHAGVNIRAKADDYADPYRGTPAQLESAVNCLLDCLERMDDLSKENDD